MTRAPFALHGYAYPVAELARRHVAGIDLPQADLTGIHALAEAHAQCVGAADERADTLVEQKDGAIGARHAGRRVLGRHR
jgi:hypothetical protein